MKIAIIITSFKEPATISKAVEQVYKAINLVENHADFEVIIVTPDQETLNAAQQTGTNLNARGFQTLQDEGKGKPAALNLAVSKTTADYFIFTDGDVYIDELSLVELIGELLSSNSAGVTSHPISLDDRNTFWGYTSHLFCEAAHQRRLNKNKYTHMSGYLYAIKSTEGLFPLDTKLRSEDAYISSWLVNKGNSISYAPESLVYVRFPKNLSDWIKQKKRSLGGAVQISSPESKSRNISEDISMLFFPIKFAKNPKEFFFSLLIYPLRIYLWAIVYINHLSKNYSDGAWERIESSKNG